MTETPKPRRRFRFSLKTLLIVVMLLSLPLGWMAKEMVRAERQRKAVEAIREAGGDVYYDYHFEREGIRLGTMSSTPAWLLRIFGEDCFADVAYVNFGSVEGTDDVMLKLIADELPELMTLHVHGTLITDAGLGHLTGLTALEQLSVADSQVTDSGLMQLKVLTRLEALMLSGQKVTDGGLEHLQCLGSLKALWVYNTCVTANGILEFQEALPNCEVLTESPWAICGETAGGSSRQHFQEPTNPFAPQTSITIGP